MGRPLTVEQAREILGSLEKRRERWPEEPEETTLLVVLLNYGDHLTPVRCIRGEWQGTKGDLSPGTGIPRCPSGHPLIESGKQHRLGLVEFDPLDD